VLSAIEEKAGGESHLDAELDRVEAVLAAASEGERLRAAGRIRSLLAAALAERDEGAHADLEDVSDEEMLELIDREFGAV
jgi:hypothetical protein